MSHTLDKNGEFWDGHAVRDPLWAVLSAADKANRGWDVDRFFATGVNELQQVFYELERLGIHSGRRRALDFGCGVGRLSQALAMYFDHVVGVDVSARMVEQATRFNRRPASVEYVRNVEPHLRIFPDESFDVVYSNLVLQHIAPPMAVEYVKEFLRVARGGGLAVFQLPSHQIAGQVPAEPTGPSAMPEDAYRAAISLVGEPPTRVTPGDSCTLVVDVTNVSGHLWAQQRHGVLRLGNHWLVDEATPRLLVQDDGRSVLPESVGSGESCRLRLMVTAPPAVGSYVCELDIAHEGVRWFQDQGSPVLRFPVVVAEGQPRLPDHAAEWSGVGARHASPLHVARSDADQAPGDLMAPDPGGFPMFGVDTATVIGVVSDAGGEVLHRLDDRSCGHDWVSYRYVVRKVRRSEQGE